MESGRKNEPRKDCSYHHDYQCQRKLLRHAAAGGLPRDRSRPGFATAAAFVPAQPYTLGSDSRTEPDLRAPGIRNVDFSLMRNQLIRERLNVQFRAEAFNIFNTPQLSAPESSVTSSTFGRILGGGGGNRALQMGLRLSF